MRVLVTQKGPIDRHQPGDDVSGLYDKETITRLVKEGFLRRSYAQTDDEQDELRSVQHDEPQEVAPPFGAVDAEDVLDDEVMTDGLRAVKHDGAIGVPVSNDSD